jgi:hypothetical protein
MLKKLIVIFCFSIVVLPALAQGPPPPPNCPTPPCAPVPLDGGMSLLIGAGLAYGVKKMFPSKKNIS